MPLRSLLLVTVAFTAVLASAQEFTIKRQPKVGDTFKYRLRAELDLGEARAVMTGLSVEKVTKVGTDGTYDVESTSTEGKVEMEGRTYDVPQPGPMTTTYGALGEVVALKGSKIDSSVYRMSNLNAFRFPDKAVKVGDSWTRELVTDPKTGVVPSKATFTVEAAEAVGTINTLKIKFVYAETLVQGSATADGYMWIDPADGTMVKTELNIKNAPFPQSPVPVTAKLTVTRE